MKLKREGFTLIELMAAMLILIIIVMMMVTVFNDAEKMWYLGTGRTMNCISGRAAMNLIAHDLEYAAADDVLTFMAKPDRDGTMFYGTPVIYDEMCFVSLQNDSADGCRTAREVFYYVTTNSTAASPAQPGNLMRGYYSAAISSTNYQKHCYMNRRWYDDAPVGLGRNNSMPRPIVEHVVALSFLAPTNQNGYCGNDYFSTNSYNYSSNLVFRDSLPEYVDVFLEVLDELDALKLSGVTNKAAFVEQNARRYSTRVHFQNRQGYKKR